MSIFEKLTERINDRIRNPALVELVKEQSLRDLLTKRAFRISQGYLQRVLLLTDGEPTSGIKDFTSIVSQVAEQKARGISITALGFGPEYNEELMAGVARRSGGNYYYIASPEEIPGIFEEELGELGAVVAQNLTVDFADRDIVVQGGRPEDELGSLA